MTSSVIANSDNTRKVYDIKVLRLCSKIESIPFFEWDEAVHKKPYKCTWNECKSIRTCAMITFMKCRKCRIYFRLNLTNPAFTETATSMVREGCLNLVVIQFAWPPPDSVCCHYPPPLIYIYQGMYSGCCWYITLVWYFASKCAVFCFVFYPKLYWFGVYLPIRNLSGHNIRELVRSNLHISIGQLEGWHWVIKYSENEILP